MAREFVLSPPLCFLATRFGKLELKVIKSALADFYTSEDISGAKQQLKEDAENIVVLFSLSGTSRLPRRTEGENRIQLEVDDIIALFTFLDEKNVVQYLPIYVADSPDVMPHLRVIDNDFNLLVAKVDKMVDQIKTLQETICTLQATVRTLSSSSQSFGAVGGARPGHVLSSYTVPDRTSQDIGLIGRCVDKQSGQDMNVPTAAHLQPAATTSSTLRSSPGQSAQ